MAPECPEGECVANYCGGCNAEFYDESGFAVCQEQSCKSEADCAGSEYCASDSVCAGDGACEHDVDCNLPGNDYPHIECVGHGICDQASGRCGFQCGVLCTPGESTPPDACGNVCSCTAGGRWICSERPCISECATDKDCMATGCSGQVCAAQSVITTCEWRSEYACYRDPAITRCGCEAGRCGWDATAALKECLAVGGPAM